MTEHRLDPLLKPRSIALMGATEREGAPGRVLAEMVLQSPYAGKAYPVNPRFDEILGVPCHATLAELPETVDHVVIALGNSGLEDALKSVIDHGARAVTIFASGVQAEDTEPRLPTSLRRSSIPPP